MLLGELEMLWMNDWLECIHEWQFEILLNKKQCQKFFPIRSLLMQL